MKAIIPRDDIYTEIGAAYLHETRFESGLSAGGISVFTNFFIQLESLGSKGGAITCRSLGSEVSPPLFTC